MCLPNERICFFPHREKPETKKVHTFLSWLRCFGFTRFSRTALPSESFTAAATESPFRYSARRTSIGRQRCLLCLQTPLAAYVRLVISLVFLLCLHNKDVEMTWQLEGLIALPERSDNYRVSLW